MEVSAEIRAVELAAVVAGAGVVLKNGGGGRQVGLCPFHDERGGSFTVYPGNTFYCFGCGAGGDAAEFVMRFYSVEFPEALRRLGIETEKTKTIRKPAPRPVVKPEKTTSKTPAPVYGRPSGLWIEKATRFAGWCHEQLLKNGEQMGWLQARGIEKDAVIKRRLGWNPGESDEKPCFFRHRSSWGLPDEVKDNGRKKMLWLPRGLVIPLVDGEDVLRLRIRGDRPRYYVVPGSNMDLMVFDGDNRCLVVVESELDAVMLSGIAGDLAGFVAIGSSTAKPDSKAEFYLKNASYVILALDYDQAGEKALAWWKTNFPLAKVWPLQDGKDPGEAYQAGCDLREWILAAWPPGWHLQRAALGQRPAAKPARAKKRDRRQGMPKMVLELAELIKDSPVSVLVTDDQLKIISPAGWNYKNWDRFGRISELVYFTPEVWDYLHGCGFKKITSDNLLGGNYAKSAAEAL